MRVLTFGGIDRRILRCRLLTVRSRYAVSDALSLNVTRKIPVPVEHQYSCTTFAVLDVIGLE